MPKIEWRKFRKDRSFFAHRSVESTTKTIAWHSAKQRSHMARYFPWPDMSEIWRMQFFSFTFSTCASIKSRQRIEMCQFNKELRKSERKKRKRREEKRKHTCTPMVGCICPTSCGFPSDCNDLTSVVLPLLSSPIRSTLKFRGAGPNAVAIFSKIPMLYQADKRRFFNGVFCCSEQNSKKFQKTSKNYTANPKMTERNKNGKHSTFSTEKRRERARAIHPIDFFCLDSTVAWTPPVLTPYTG